MLLFEQVGRALNHVRDIIKMLGRVEARSAGPTAKQALMLKSRTLAAELMATRNYGAHDKRFAHVPHRALWKHLHRSGIVNRR